MIRSLFRLGLTAFFILGAIFLATPTFAQQAAAAPAAPQTPAYLDPNLPVDQRVDDLVSRMTLEEKASQVVHLAAAIPRLKVPAYNWWTEALHGVAAGTATVFPEPIGLAATFDTPLIHEMATVIGTEARAKHQEDIRHGNDTGVGLDFWAPNINIFRDPRWGRGQETYGEDPFLTGRMGVAFVTGMQGDDPKYYRVISTPKHYAVHSGPEPARHNMDIVVSRHDEEDTYLPAFRATVTEAKAGSVMCAYNRINGEPACANTFLLEDQLRGAWKFQGYVVSDCGAVEDIQEGHHFVATLPEAAAAAIKHSMDLECNGSDYSHYVAAVQKGLLKESELDVAVKRLMRARMRLGMFDPPEMVKYAETPFSENDSEPHRQLALAIARETMVLLRNDGILPLNPTVKKIAVVGPLADSPTVLLGNYNGIPSRSTTVLDGIRQQFTGATVTFAPGTAFLRGGKAVPGSALSTPDGHPGLKGEYFQGTELQGAPVVTRTDAEVNFDFNDSSPAPGLGRENYSVRWTGFLTPDQSGNYQLGATGDDGYRLWLDGKLIVEDWSSHAPSTKTLPVPLEEGRKYAVKLEYFQGGGGAVAKLIWTPPGEAPLPDALATTKDADVVIAVVGINADLEGEESSVDIPGFKGGDRTSIDLPQEEEDLLKAVKAQTKPLIVVLMNGSALAVNWANENANAILEAWYPGEEGGKAVAETLAGANNPAGRLPVTFYKGTDQLPAFEDYAMKNRTYRYFNGEPLYPFGFGLSYSQFAYSNLKVSAANLKAGDPLTVEADVRNASQRDGDEVAQLYLMFPSVPGAPLRALRGFTRVHVAGGASAHVSFTLDPRDLSMVNEAGLRVIVPGDYRVSVGGGQPGTSAAQAEGKFSITGERKLPD
ncbi:Xylan 1,4-beta-xylosidase [Candidatus Sulfotelmatobacter kueseliae]|uniref:Xylan 1,4-beta-xylosidase n=1 Tax=Candidatus Sulfotelmatobacter kueseliae TaxID=2042962 RepID=A0A2U3LDF4_9BACT|nr:Xylan 1,4-beta-xylosidase [Candidatus Sulfotelmatobacter kueseliae]